MWKDARAQAVAQAAKWPYDWVDSADYPHKDQRSTVSGTFHLVDPLMPGGARFTGGMMVGMTAADHMPAEGSGAPPRLVTWQTDAKHYQYWAKFEDETGKFAVPNVRPGAYTLRAYADGILGDFAKADVVAPEGESRWIWGRWNGRRCGGGSKCGRWGSRIGRPRSLQAVRIFLIPTRRSNTQLYFRTM